MNETIEMKTKIILLHVNYIEWAPKSHTVSRPAESNSTTLPTSFFSAAAVGCRLSGISGYLSKISPLSHLKDVPDLLRDLNQRSGPGSVEATDVIQQNGSTPMSPHVFLQLIYGWQKGSLPVYLRRYESSSCGGKWLAKSASPFSRNCAHEFF